MAKNISFQLASLILLGSSLAGGDPVKPVMASASAVSSQSMSAKPSSTTPSQKSSASDTALPVTPVTKTTKPLPLHKTYAYQADRYRDPFVPLIGAESKSDANDRAPQIASLSLKGIIQDTKGRMAILTSGVSSYILKGGRLYDANNKAVRGISGVVKSTSVMLIGADRTVKEIRIAKPSAL